MLFLPSARSRSTVCACVPVCGRVHQDVSVCTSVPVLGDKCGGKSPFLFFQDHYLSFQSQRRALGSKMRRSKRGMCDCVLLDAYEKSNTGDWLCPVLMSSVLVGVLKMDTLMSPHAISFIFSSHKNTTSCSRINV